MEIRDCVFPSNAFRCQANQYFERVTLRPVVFAPGNFTKNAERRFSELEQDLEDGELPSGQPRTMTSRARLERFRYRRRGRVESGYKHVNRGRSHLPGDLGRPHAKRYPVVNRYCDRPNCSIQNISLGVEGRMIDSASSGQHIEYFSHTNVAQQNEGPELH